MSRFHSHSGWFFERRDDGSVEITRRIPIHDDFRGPVDGWPVEYVRLDPDTWASVVASVSARGEMDGRFFDAQAFHAGDEDPEFKRLARHHLEAENIAAQMADLLRNVRALPNLDASMGTVIDDHVQRWDEHQTPAWPEVEKGAVTEPEEDAHEVDIRRLEDALLLVWGELPAEQSLELRRELPALMDFCAHLHHSIEHERAMVRRNVWADPPGDNVQ